MRLIGSLDDERKGLIFSAFLQRKGIAHQLEFTANTDWGSPQYGTSRCDIWIYEEDQLDETLQWFRLFVENSNDPQFTSAATQSTYRPSAAQEEASPLISTISKPTTENLSYQVGTEPTETTTWNRQPMGMVTRILLFTCCILFFLTQISYSPRPLPAHFPFPILFASPVDKALWYDYPYTYQLLDKAIKLYGDEALESPNDLPQEGRYLIQKAYHTPFWVGFYTIIQQGGWEAIGPTLAQTPLFEKIQAGEIWRLFSPALLHSDLFHIFFNMIWLIVLGKQLEQRLGTWRYIIFILTAGIVSNTAQYLMAGPNFIGFSGILCAMLAFIWIRQRQTPWEGYQLDRMTIAFIFIFIIGIALLQSLFFFVGLTTGKFFSVGIANTAHLTGAFVGLILGKLNFFSWRHA